jgi:hypothetical protein
MLSVVIGGLGLLGNVLMGLRHIEGSETSLSLEVTGMAGWCVGVVNMHMSTIDGLFDDVVVIVALLEHSPVERTAIPSEVNCTLNRWIIPGAVLIVDPLRFVEFECCELGWLLMLWVSSRLSCRQCFAPGVESEISVVVVSYSSSSDSLLVELLESVSLLSSSSSSDSLLVELLLESVSLL